MKTFKQIRNAAVSNDSVEEVAEMGNDCGCPDHEQHEDCVAGCECPMSDQKKSYTK
jgi:hypothetical protein